MEVTDITCFSKQQHKRIINYNILEYHISANNSVHVTLDFKPGTTRMKQDVLWKRFIDKMIQVTGLKHSRVAAFGWTFGLNSKGHEWPHAHGVIYSTKDRRSGITISKLPQDQRRQLQEFWMNETGHTMNMKRVYDPVGLVQYIAGPSNLESSDKQTVENLTTVNRNLLKSKMKLKQAA